MPRSHRFLTISNKILEQVTVFSELENKLFAFLIQFVNLVLSLTWDWEYATYVQWESIETILKAVRSVPVGRYSQTIEIIARIKNLIV